ncbi:MAG TPA: hypothetical protein PL085_16960 [Agriterribacter sp.]|uniref:hypothetical protein n=1 Tax=Agriterribacter sp. TaxID=2821509 RepID=UPI002CA33F5D|nr:hypothetical protein [Agriterribacter sp.]HRQ18767.1 hypothetical protein [Agriterribacter sp.]
MIKLSEIKAGDIVNARFEDVVNTGQVLDIDREERKVLVAHGDQEFWYSNDDLSAIPLTTNMLEMLGFTLSSDPAFNEEGTAYIKGPFIVRYLKKDSNRLLLTYRDEHREIDNDLSVHQFQNHYQVMTNMHLELS